ncbi:MAG: YqjK family protein [Steroidobacteraceae bacterium]
MSATQAALAARRAALAARCAEQRAALRGHRSDIDATIAPLDRGLETARSVLPLVAVGGIVALVVAGPARAVKLARSGLAVALAAGDILSLVRGLTGR